MRGTNFKLALLLCGVFATAEQENNKEAAEVRESRRELEKIFLQHGHKLTGALMEQIDLEQLGKEVTRRLESTEWKNLPPLQNSLAEVLPILKSYPEGRPYASWLEQRMDYIIVADAWLRHIGSAGFQPEPPPKKAPHTDNSDAKTQKTPPKPAEKRPQPDPAPEPRADYREQAKEKGPSYAIWRKRVEKRPLPSRAGTIIPRAKQAFAFEGIPTELVWISEVESSLNPQARSPAGAAGLFQFMPATARRFGLKTSPADERLDPEKSAAAAAKYLRILYKHFGRWDLAIAAYNAGEGRVGKTIRKTGGNTFDTIAYALPVETRMYVPKVLATIEHREKVDPHKLPPPK